jgi:hypothetical protein
MLLNKRRRREGDLRLMQYSSKNDEPTRRREMPEGPSAAVFRDAHDPRQAREMKTVGHPIGMQVETNISQIERKWEKPRNRP